MTAGENPSGPWALVRGIEPFLTPPGELPPVAADLACVEGDLERPERRIIVAGAFKTGKSSLVNALVGAPIMPVRARQPSRRIAELGYGDMPAAFILRPDGTQVDVPFDAARQEILAGDTADRVQIRVPSPLLKRAAIVLDTPGLGEDPAVSAAVLEAVARADLAVMVLAADKILSATERAFAAEIDGLLAGNVVYVVNRLDLIDEEDRAEVLDWARTVLAASGNELTGRPRIFGTSVSGSAAGQGLGDVRRWLLDAQTSGLLDRIAAVSRLARLRRLAAAAATQFGGSTAAARTRVEKLQRMHSERIARERTLRAARLGTARRQLAAILAGLGAEEERFITGAAEETLARLQHERGAVPLQVRSAMIEWRDGVTSAVHDILSEVPVSAPPFSLEDWIVRIQVEQPADTPDEIGGRVGEAVSRIFDGGRAGRETGAAIGSWIGKTVLGVDAAAERRKRIDRAARSLLSSLRAETERYLAGVVVLLDEVERDAMAREERNPELEAAQGEEEEQAALYHWAGTLVQQADTFLRAIPDVGAGPGR